MTEDQALQLLLDNPKLMEELLKLTKKDSINLPKVEKPKKERLPTRPAYVSHLKIKCRLCGSHHFKFILMTFDPNPDSLIYRSGEFSDFNKWPDLDIKPVFENVQSCLGCHNTLVQYSKEELIKLLIDLSHKENLSRLHTNQLPNAIG